MKQVSKLHVTVKFTQPSLYREFQSVRSKELLLNKLYTNRKTQERPNFYEVTFSVAEQLALALHVKRARIQVLPLIPDILTSVRPGKCRNNNSK
jgi:hypothetical protein